jgi:hypothetical protein
MGKMGAKNLLKIDDRNTSVFKTNNGMITINGTTFTYTILQIIRDENALPHGKYIMSWDIDDDSLDTNVMLQFGYVSDGTFIQKQSCNVNKRSVVCDVTDEFDGKIINIRIGIPSGVTVNNITVYPMLRLASDQDDTWQPYAMTNKELTDKLNDRVEFTAQELQAMW